MRMILPGVRERRAIDRQLTDFFRAHREAEFRHAIWALSRFYHLRAPQVDWYEYLDWGRTAGRCYEDGKIHLVHPENWKKGRKYNSERKWIQTVYHELGHYANGHRRPGPLARSCVTQSRPHRRRRRSRSR